MDIKYNIYRISKEKLELLETELHKFGLVKQKTKSSNKFDSTFYFSENQKGNDVWWISTYKMFLNNQKSIPKNIFHYGLLISKPKSKTNKHAFLVSLGKSHFYLGKFIERDFGINLAVRVADEETTLLKKSTYFSSIKTGEMSSYKKFIKDNYEPGESVDHLKIKAKNANEWGDKNIIFSDSIQVSADIPPDLIETLLDRIERNMKKGEIISLPKLEPVKNSNIINKLDKNLLTSIKKGSAGFSLSEFEVVGGNIAVISDNFNYCIYTKAGRGAEKNIKELGNNLDRNDIVNYVASLDKCIPIEDIKIKSSHEVNGKKSNPLKESMEFSVTLNSQQFLLRHGSWFSFNNTFMQYLKNSIDRIPCEIKDALIEREFKEWQEKQKEDSEDNKVTYREFYFNNKLCTLYKYDLLDRKTESVTSVNSKSPSYKVEVADLYDKNSGEIIALKISDDISALIYNITQSLTSVELHMKANLANKMKIKKASLWFVLSKKREKITDINSINLLLSLENWKKRVSSLGLEVKIYISHHDK